MSAPEPLIESLSVDQVLPEDDDDRAPSLKEALADLDEAWDTEDVVTWHIGGWLILRKSEKVSYFEPVDQKEDWKGGSLFLIDPPPDQILNWSNMVSKIVRVSFTREGGSNKDCMFRLDSLEKLASAIYRLHLKETYLLTTGKRLEDYVFKSPSETYYLAPGIVGTDQITYLTGKEVETKREKDITRKTLEEHEDKLDALKKLLLAALDAPEGVVGGAARQARQSFNEKKRKRDEEPVARPE